jgi:hypothetical protein
MPLPDNLEFPPGTVVDPDGIVHATGGVTVTITSLLENDTLKATADSAVYDTKTGEADLSGGVSLTLVERDFTIRCTRFTYDPLMMRIFVSGLDVGLPFAALTAGREMPEMSSLGEEEHFHNIALDSIFLAAGEARFDLSADNTSLVIDNARFTHSARPDPDLYLTAREVRLTPDQQVEFSGLALYISGVKLMGWSHLTRKLKPEPQPLSISFPRVKVNREGGDKDHQVNLGWKQGATVDLGPVKGDLLVDYATEYGTLSHAYIYTEPIPGAKLGIEGGTTSEVDLLRRSIERRDDYNFVYRQRFKSRSGPVRDAWLGFEYGHSTLHYEEVVKATDPKVVIKHAVEDTRMLATATIDLPPLRLNDQLYLATGANFKYARYEDSGKEYRVTGGKAGLVWRDGAYESYVLGKANDASGEAVFPYDAVRERELDFAVSMRLHPSWRQTVFGIYDFERDEFSTFQLGALKRQKTYEVGMYYDFIRDSAGLEFGLLFD